MFPSSFDESNHVLGRPEGLSDEDCGPLSVFVGNQADGLPVVVSCWKPTEAELEEIIRTKRVWLGIIGHTMPPAWVSGVKPFDSPPKKEP